MHIRCYENLAELAAFAPAWDELANGCVFRSWPWLATWWRHYGESNPRRRLAVLAAYADLEPHQTAPTAVLPCYVDSTWQQGRVLRLLGDGEVCSDHIGMLACSDLQQAANAVEAMAVHLADRDDWDLIDFTGVDGDDAATAAIFDQLQIHDCTVSRLLADRCWVIDLPATWDDFLALQSKSHRKQLRQLERRVLQSERARWRLVQSSSEFADAWTTLVDLHQRRRQSLGEPGCFASAKWAAFHWEVAQLLLAKGELRLSTLELDGEPIAAEYHLAGRRATFAYQGGVEPRRLEDEPGQLSTLQAIQHAIAEGHSQFDLLRGDEPYKAHWRAAARQAVRRVAVPPRMWPRLRSGAWTGARRMATAAKQLTGLFS